MQTVQIQMRQLWIYTVCPLALTTPYNSLEAPYFEDLQT